MTTSLAIKKDLVRLVSPAWDKMVEEDKTDNVLESDEVTVKMYAKLINKQENTALRKLNRRLADGQVTRRRVIINAHYVWAYRPTKFRSRSASSNCG